MNIVFCSRVDFNEYKGGIERITVTLSEFFRNRGHNIFYIVLINSEKNIRYKNPVFYLKNSDPYTSENIEEYNNILDDIDADIVINQYGMSSPESLLFSSIKNKKHKLIHVLHSTPFALYKNFWSYTKTFHGLNFLIRFILYFFLKRRYYNARVAHFKILDKEGVNIVTLCNKDKEDLMPFIKLAKVEVFHNCINTNLDNIVLPPKKKKVLLLVTRLEKTEKAPQNLIPIWKKVSSSCLDWELQIIGDGPDKNWIEAQFKKAKLKRYKFYGFCDPKPFYKDASIFPLVSNSEGFSMVLLEAMKYGVLPFAYSSFNSVSDILLPESIVPKNNSSLYASKIIQLIGDSDLQENLRNDYSHHLLNFSVEKIGSQWLDLFDSIKNEDFVF